MDGALALAALALGLGVIGGVILGLLWVIRTVQRAADALHRQREE